MAYPPSSEDELAEMQKLSNEYEPEVKGPLVGQRQPSTAITTEYASADPVLQTKTTTLPQTYSHYRTIRGDGKCGWRAVAFGYFEALIHTGDVGKLHQEEARLRATSNLINRGGFDPSLVEDFADETFGLLRKLADVLHQGRAEQTLLDSFNDDTVQNYIITHLRTLAAAWMKTNSEEYAGFLVPQTVDSYCDSTILPVGAEIDHFGLNALHNVLLSLAGIALEVLYLDRSEGTEVNVHRFDPVTAAAGNVRLLYRPGHYDMLYKLDEVPQKTTTNPVTYLQFASQPDQEIYDINVSGFLTNIPGISYAPSQNWMSSGYSSSPDTYLLPASAQSGTDSLPIPVGPTTQPTRTQPMYAPPTTTAASAHLAPPPTQMPADLPMQSISHSAVSHPELQQPSGSSPFRPSAWQLEPDFVSATSQMPFQTSIFRNSHFNTAHFMNPDFQPEQWDPQDEYTAPGFGKGSRHKSTG